MTVWHVMIRASAGSGKTYALTNRFVGLLAQGAPPDRIVALTFTRKAAGEFFDEILNKLAGAAGGEAEAARLGLELGHPRLGREDFLRLLRSMVEAMPRLRLGTLDGFFGRIARAFPLELGLAGEFEILQPHAAGQERRRVLQRMFARNEGGLDDAQREFVEAFKRATFGMEEKRLSARLEAFLNDHQETYLAAPAGEQWGDAARIWPGGCAWLRPAGRPIAEVVAALRRELERMELNEKQRARWHGFLDLLPEWKPGAPLADPVEYLLKNTLAVWDDVQRGQAEVTVERKKVRLGPGACAELAILIRQVIGGELARRLETTRGIHAVLRAYETVYDEAVRRGGKLTFGDVQRLLQPERAFGGEGWEPSLLAPVTADGRLMLDYRLDAKFDHWLLDEFQDTSFGQWQVLENLIDEVVMDPSQGRSFFCVGDVKQAIFTWREGDPRLFRDILERYNQAAADTIKEEHLVRSFRSGPAVIGMVNAIFGCREVIANLFPGAASTAWNREWLAHESARPQLAGCAAWLHADEPEERLARMVHLLQEIAPLERGLECAVLVQTNAMATAVADYLRREGGFPALAESDLRIGTDNPLTVAMLALVQVAAHPSDTLAWEHVAMSPLGAALGRAGLVTPEAVTTRLLQQIHDGGFESAMAYWLDQLEESLAPTDAFSRLRARQLVDAAALFDATGSRRVADFVEFAQLHVVRGSEVSGAIRVMTIHKSKGLGFDVVILPDLEGQRVDQRRSGLAVRRTDDRRVQWVLDLPPKIFVEQDATLRTHVAAEEAEAGYEALALLYVGLTRAKRAMYVLTKAPGKSASRNYPRLLADTLGDAPWSTGQADWFAGFTPGKEVEAWQRNGVDPGLVVAEPAPRRPARRPSSATTGVVSALKMLALDGEGGDAAEFGTAVHAMLSEVEWAGEPLSLESWGCQQPAGALIEARACVEAPSLAHVWRRPDGGEVWRERAFEIVLDGAWVAGVFDRVVLVRDRERRICRASVFDFKTDRVGDGGQDLGIVADRHAGQLNLYRRVVAMMTGLDVRQVRAEVVFTHRRQSVLVPSC